MKEANKAKVEAVLDELQKKCSARMISFEDMMDSLGRAEKSLGISKKAMDGIRVHIDYNAQKFPNAYKYTPESTIFEAVFKSGTWRVTDIYRGTAFVDGKMIRMTLTDAAKEAVIAKFDRF